MVHLAVQFVISMGFPEISNPRGHNLAVNQVALIIPVKFMKGLRFSTSVLT
jgi:hypothetical protein